MMPSLRAMLLVLLAVLAVGVLAEARRGGARARLGAAVRLRGAGGEEADPPAEDDEDAEENAVAPPGEKKTRCEHKNGYTEITTKSGGGKGCPGGGHKVKVNSKVTLNLDPSALAKGVQVHQNAQASAKKAAAEAVTSP